MTIKELLISISKREWRWVLITAIVLIVLTSAPYLYAYLNSPDGTYYNGIHALTPGDFFVYFSYINQVREGNWLLYDYYTSEPQVMGLFNIVWVTVGLLARITNLSATLAYQLARILLIPILLAILYVFLAYFFSEKNKRLLAFLFACFASGVGSYFAIASEKALYDSLDSQCYHWPIDLWMPEGNIFATMYHSPLLIVSYIMMMLSFLFFLLALKNNQYYYSLVAGFLTLIWFNFHPYYFPYFFLIISVYALIIIWRHRKWGPMWHFLICLSISLPSFFYHYYLIKTDYVIGARALQNYTPSSPFLFIFLGLGFIFLGGLIGIYLQYRSRKLFTNDKVIFLFVWLVCGFALLYSPIAFQRRFIQGLELPLIFFTIITIYCIKDYLKVKLPSVHRFLDGNYALLGLLFMIFFGFSTLFVLFRDTLYARGHYFQFYTPISYQYAADWLRINNPEKSAIFSFERTSLLLPALVNNPVFFGHRHETINSKEKLKISSNILDDKYDDQAVLDIFSAYNIKYFFYTNFDRDNFAYKPETKPYLEKVWQGEEVEIYKVK